MVTSDSELVWKMPFVRDSCSMLWKYEQMKCLHRLAYWLVNKHLDRSWTQTYHWSIPPKFLLNIVFRALYSMHVICYIQFLFWLWHASETLLRKVVHSFHSQAVHYKHYAHIYFQRLQVNKVPKMKDACVLWSLQDSFKLVDLVFSTPTWILLAKNKILK